MHVVDIGYQNVFSILFFFEALTVTGVFRGIYGLNLPKSLHCSNEVVQITVQELSYMYKLRPNSMQIPRYLTPFRVFLFTSLLITIRVGQLTPSHKIDLYAIAIGEVGAKRPRET